jgi:VanZ family protein
VTLTATSSRTRASLSLVLLLYFLGVIAVITLAPFRFRAPRQITVLFSGDAYDTITNVLLFLPLGFLYPLTRPRDDEPSPIHVFVLGALVSALIESIQLFVPRRFTSVLDVATNALGAAIGALLLRAITRRIRINARLVGRLNLESPLVGLIYLLVPLLLVASLSAVTQEARLVALLPLGMVGARLLSSVQRHHFGPAGLADTNTIVVVAGAWMVVGTFPVLIRYPVLGPSIVMLVMLTTWYETSRPLDPGGERRFEADALRSAAPYIAVYFVAIVLLPLALGVGPWRWALWLTGSRNDITQQQLRLLEPVASLTVLGYLLAEARGRLEMPFRRIVGRVAVECGLVALAIELSRGFQRATGASVSQFLLMLGAAMLGAAIYHNQREHVRWILAHRPVVTPTS